MSKAQSSRSARSKASSNKKGPSWKDADPSPLPPSTPQRSRTQTTATLVIILCIAATLFVLLYPSSGRSSTSSAPSGVNGRRSETRKGEGDETELTSKFGGRDTKSTNNNKPTIVTSERSASSATENGALATRSLSSAPTQPLCPIPWDQQQFVNWERRNDRDGLGKGAASCALPAAGTDFALGCEWMLSSQQVSVARETLWSPKTRLYPLSSDSVGTAEDFLQTRVISASKPSVDIHSRMGHSLNTIKVKRIETARGGDRVKGENGGGGVGEECALPHVDPSTCAEHTSVLFLGHSHTRFLASLHCMMIKGTACHRYDQHNNDYVLVTSDDGSEAGGPPRSQQHPIRSLYLQSNLDATHRLKYIREALIDFVNATTEAAKNSEFSLSPQKQKTKEQITAALKDDALFSDLFTHIVISKGAWETYLFERPPSSTSHELAKSLVAIRAMFPRAKIIFHLLHGYVPNRDLLGVKKPSKTKRARQEWRNACYARERIERSRVASLCGLEQYLELEAAATAALATDEKRQLASFSSSVAEMAKAFFPAGSVQPKLPAEIEVFDTIADTLDPFASNYVDGLGHHFTDGALEALVQKLLYNHICPPTSPPSRHPLPHVATSANEQLQRLRHFVANAVVSVDPLQAHKRGGAKKPFPSMAEAYGDGESASSVGRSNTSASPSIACPLVEKWSTDFKPDTRCGCLRLKYSRTPFCSAMAGHTPKRSRLGDQVDREIDP